MQRELYRGGLNDLFIPYKVKLYNLSLINKNETFNHLQNKINKNRHN